MSADGAMGSGAIEQIDVALEAEMKARRALLEIGEQWMLLQKAGGEPTDEQPVASRETAPFWLGAAELKPIREDGKNTPCDVPPRRQLHSGALTRYIRERM